MNPVPFSPEAGERRDAMPARPARPAAHNRISASQMEQGGFAVQDESANEVQRIFLKFLETFQTPQNEMDLDSAHEDASPYFYVNQLKLLILEQSTVLRFDWSHLTEGASNCFDEQTAERYQDLSSVIVKDFYRYEPYLCASVQNFMRNHHPDYIVNKNNSVEDKAFYLSIFNVGDSFLLRELRTNKVGDLAAFSGTVTRSTEVRPELIKGHFNCVDCGMEARNVVQDFKYTEPTKCGNPQCQCTKNWKLDISRSVFVDWQKVRVQELSEDIPAGSMPRCIDVILRNDCVERAKPGDVCLFTGTLVVIPNVGNMYSRGATITKGNAASDGVSGLKKMGVREMSYKLVFIASWVEDVSNGVKQGMTKCNFRQNEEQEDMDMISDLTAAERDRIIEMGIHTPNTYGLLADCIAPNIFGHENIKKGILLQMFGGVHKKTHDGCKLRGDINICIVGDPSTAKSQFLKYVKRVLPRTVYTSGKASSAAGLTAAVQRDPETGEFGIEAGALMLADNGVCCIDEFDKMDEIDQAAIHEAMEQQTITITKAGIQATLNARASILAAANPIWGRYDITKSLRMNVNLSAPIMSRFDLFFVVIDECDASVDYNVAQHILNMHRNLDEPVKSPFTIDEVQKYIRFARTLKPKITVDSRKLLVRFYVQLRQQDAEEKKAYRFTVRQLESLVRLSEALARSELQDEIAPKYVREAARLLKKSIISVDSPDVQLDDFAGLEGEEANTEREQDGMENANEEPVQKHSVGFKEYVRITNRIVAHIRRQPLTKDEDGEFLPPHLAEKQLDTWYSEQVVEQHLDEDDDPEKMTKISAQLTTFRFVVQRLINADKILIRTKDDKGESVLEVHPNYDPESQNSDLGRGGAASQAVETAAGETSAGDMDEDL